jgi:hypothetical protein
MIVSLLLILFGTLKSGGMILRWRVAQIGEFRYVCKDSSVGIASRYGLDDPEIEPVGARFLASVQTGPGAHPFSSATGTGYISRE